MRRFATALALFAVAGLAAAALAQDAPAPAALALGSKAPMTDVKMKNVDGKEFSIADVKGAKGTLVVFTCNACPWAQAWEDRIVALGNAWSRKGVGVIAVNPNDPTKVAEDGYAEMQARAKAKKFAFPYVVDATSDVARAFGATRTPEAFLFDADGKLVYHGAIDDNAKAPKSVKSRYLEDAVKAVAAGKAVPTAETKAFGCTIKFRSKA